VFEQIFGDGDLQKHEGHVWKRNAQVEFDRWARTYDQSVLNRLLFRRCYLKFIELILKHCEIDPVRDLAVLDIGCGTGTFVAMLAQTDLPIRAVGLDMAKKMCETGSAKIEQVGCGDRVDFVTADSEHLPMIDSAFDVVTCSNSFHHYPHRQTVLEQMFRVLKPGGRLIIIDGFRDNVIGWFLFDVCVPFFEKSVHHSSAGEIRELLTSVGFEELSQEKFGFWVPVLATVGRKKSVPAVN